MTDNIRWVYLNIDEWNGETPFLDLINNLDEKDKPPYLISKEEDEKLIQYLANRLANK